MWWGGARGGVLREAQTLRSARFGHLTRWAEDDMLVILEDRPIGAHSGIPSE